jgi:hypothetical protein
MATFAQKAAAIPAAEITRRNPEFLYFKNYPDVCCNQPDWQHSIDTDLSLQVKGLAGSHIRNEIIPSMLGVSNMLNHSVHAELNDVVLYVYPEDELEYVLIRWGRLREAQAEQARQKRAEYEASPEYAQAQAEAKAQQVAERKRFDELLAIAPAQFTVSDQAKWDATIAGSTDGYGKAICDYAELWARMMEGQISNGASLEDIAKESSHLADTEGITGNMYGVAVSILSACWVHGDSLRRWHNGKYGNQGETAAGAVINPAVFTIAV